MINVMFIMLARVGNPVFKRRITMLTLRNSFLPTKQTENYDRGLTTRDYFDRLWQHTVNDFFSDFSRPWTDILDSKKNEDGTLSIYIDVPGVKEEDISIELISSSIRIKAERKNRNSSWSLNKSFTIPSGYSAEDLKAELSDGVLVLTLKGEPIQEEPIKKINISKK